MRGMQISRRRGFSYIEIMTATLILAVCVTALVSTWYVAMNMTVSTNEQGIAYNLARETLEQLKETGFDNTAEAPPTTPVVHYYDINQNSMDATPTAARFKVTTTVVSDLTIANSNPVQPAMNALRTVTVTVYY